MGPGTARRVGFALSLLLSGCAGRDDAGAWTQRDSSGVTVVENSRPRHADWRLEEAPLVEIGGGADASGSAPRDPVSVFADREGRIHVADRAAAGGSALLVYDDQGRFLHRVGGEGEGPGALGQLAWAAPYAGDSLVAFDLGGKKLLVFDGEGAFGRELAIPVWRREGAYGVPGYTAGAVGPMEDGHFLTYPVGALDRLSVEGPAWYRHDLVKLSPAGERWDTLGVFEIFQTWLAPAWTEPYPFGSVAHVAPFGEGFVFSTGETFELREHDATGALRRIVRRAHAPSPVNAADLEQYREWFVGRARASAALDSTRLAQLTQQLAQAHHPERRPAISNLLVDGEGNVWAEEFRWVDPTEIAPQPRPSTWSVFGADGRWLAEVDVPAGFLVSAISRDRVYGFAVDAAGAKSVRVYQLIP